MLANGYRECSPHSASSSPAGDPIPPGEELLHGCFQGSLGGAGGRINGKIGGSSKAFAVKAFYAACSKRLSAF